MQNRDRLLKSKILYSLLFATMTAPLIGAELYDDKKVSQIEIVIDAPGETGVDPKPILSRMKTQQGDTFSQLIFDSDLKALSEEYEKVVPVLSLKDGKVSIEVHVAPRPIIHQIE